MYKDQMHCQLVVGVFERKFADVDEFATLEPLCVIPPVEHENRSPDPNRHENPILDPASSLILLLAVLPSLLLSQMKEQSIL